MKKTFWWTTSVLILLMMVTVGFKSTDIIKTDDAKITTKTASLTSEVRFDNMVNDVYSTMRLQGSGLDINVFQKAITGFYNLKLAHKLPFSSNILTVVDFTKPSHEKRMWIIDLQSKMLLLNTWVAHGQGSGNDLADHFSNNEESHQSSLGFYVTDDIYMGKHGRSLRLDGMDEGFNNKARERAIVLHAADYVCQGTINQLGRIGRSFGCPAVSPDVIGQVINTLKGKTVLFINGQDTKYTSKYLNASLAASFAVPDTTSRPVLSARL